MGSDCISSWSLLIFLLRMLLVIAGRPTEIPEHDVWVCESKYHEVEKNIRKLSKGLKVGTCSLLYVRIQIISLQFHRNVLRLAEMSRLVKNQQNDLCAQQRQVSLGIRPVWSESSLCAQWVAKDPSFHHSDSEDPDQTGRMPRLVWVFARRTWLF